jgi:predicted ribosome quality control (RQC) complex YloA/Tae2 family protein
MHLNYHFLKFLCPELSLKLAGLSVSECFSQNKDELIIELSSTDQQIYIRALLHPSNTVVSFPSDFKRKKKNTVSLFPDLINEKISHVMVANQERAFYVFMQSGSVLLFKLHGSRSNVLFYKDKDSIPFAIFRHDIQEDLELTLDQLDKSYEINHSRFIELEGNASQFLPTLGKIPREWLKANGYLDASLDQKWNLIQELLDILESPLYSIIKKNREYHLSLLPESDYVIQTEDPIRACNELFKYSVVIQAFEKEKNDRIRSYEDQKKRTLAYIEKTEEKLNELVNGPSPSELADVIMANLHFLDGKSGEEVVLFNFYSNKEEVFQIKRGLSPQKFAENLYRKSKNRKIELHQLKENLQKKLEHLEFCEDMIENLISIQDHRGMRDFVKENGLEVSKKEVQEQIPFKRFEAFGFEILVGKSSKANDEMLRYYTYKEDLWLHAKDVSGSHVLIKYQSGKTFPKPVVERAAELALYYSKSKNESFAPVTFTAAKYVRKIKGAPAGAVMVDKESVMMCSPKGPVDNQD